MHPLSRTNKVAMIARLGALVGLALLVVCPSPNASAQSWASTATKAYPVQYLQKAVAIGALASSTPMHIVVGLQEQNANQVQPTLRAMLTPGNALYGTSLTVQQFVARFGATTSQVQAVENYLSSAGFTSVTVADNQLLVEADGTAGEVESAFNTKLEQYTVNGATVYLNTAPAQVPASLSDSVIAVLGLNNVVRCTPTWSNRCKRAPTHARRRPVRHPTPTMKLSPPSNTRLPMMPRPLRRARLNPLGPQAPARVSSSPRSCYRPANALSSERLRKAM